MAQIVRLQVLKPPQGSGYQIATEGLIPKHGNWWNKSFGCCKLHSDFERGRGQALSELFLNSWWPLEAWTIPTTGALCGERLHLKVFAATWSSRACWVMWKTLSFLKRSRFPFQVPVPAQSVSARWLWPFHLSFCTFAVKQTNVPLLIFALWELLCVTPWQEGIAAAERTRRHHVRSIPPSFVPVWKHMFS